MTSFPGTRHRQISVVPHNHYGRHSFLYAGHACSVPPYYWLIVEYDLSSRQFELRLWAARIGEDRMFAIVQSLDPQAWLADVLAPIADIPQRRLGELLPWNWRTAETQRQAA